MRRNKNKKCGYWHHYSERDRCWIVYLHGRWLAECSPESACQILIDKHKLRAAKRKLENKNLLSKKKYYEDYYNNLLTH